MIEPLVTHQQGNAFEQGRLVELERNFCDNDAEASAFGVFDGSHAAHDDATLAGGIGAADALGAHNQPARGEVWAADQRHQVVNADLVWVFPVVNQISDAVSQFTQIMRGNVGCHAHGNAG